MTKEQKIHMFLENHAETRSSSGIVLTLLLRTCLHTIRMECFLFLPSFPHERGERVRNKNARILFGECRAKLRKYNGTPNIVPHYNRLPPGKTICEWATCLKLKKSEFFGPAAATTQSGDK